jgi:hypothetical protein
MIDCSWLLAQHQLPLALASGLNDLIALGFSPIKPALL